MRNLGDFSDGKCLIRYIIDREMCMNIKIQVFSDDFVNTQVVPFDS